MPGLEKEKKPAPKPVEKLDKNLKEDELEMEKEILEGLKDQKEAVTNTNGSSNQIKLYWLNEETLTASSKVTDIDVHRKLFNDSLVNFLKNKVKF
jgi:hypothetical protein